MVDVVALVLVTRKDNNEQVEIGEEFEVEEEASEALIDKGVICLSKDYVPPPPEEGEEIEVEIEVEVEIIEEVVIDEDWEQTLPEELELFEKYDEGEIE